MITAIVGLLGAAVPLISGFFTSDKQEVVSKGLELVGSVLGVPPKEDIILETLRTNPAAIEKLREYEMREYVQLSEERVALEGLYVSNVKDARQMTRDSDKAAELQRRSIRDNTWMLAGVIIGVFFIILVRPEVFKSFPEITNVLYVIITALVMTNREITGFLFGSSLQSRSQGLSTPQGMGSRAGSITSLLNNKG